MKKIISKLVCFGMCLAVASSLFLFGFSNMETAYASMGKIIVAESENGNFEKVPSVYSIFRSNTAEISTIGVNSEVFKEIGLENYFINVAPNTFMPVTKTIYFANDFSNRSQQTVLSSEGIARVNDFYEDMAGTETSLIIYSNGLSSGYIGYGGKTYYQEIFEYQLRSAMKVVGEDNSLQEYIRISLDSFVMIGTAFIANPLISVAVSAVHEFISNVLSSGQATNNLIGFGHEARLLEDKTVKNIYTMNNYTGTLFMGAEVEKTKYRYENIVGLNKGATSTSDIFYSNYYLSQSNLYDSAEEATHTAINNYLLAPYPYRNPVVGYRYKNTWFDSYKG